MEGGKTRIYKQNLSRLIRLTDFFGITDSSGLTPLSQIRDNGIINNGPKEDKTLDAKAPDTGEKSSIMDRLKSAKAEKQKECCPPQKHKGEIEL